MISSHLLHAFSSTSSLAAGALIAAVWQGMLLACAAALAVKLLPRMPAAARFALWFAVFAVVALLPLLSVWTHGAASSPSTPHAPWLSFDPRWSEALLAVWLVASAVRAILLAAAGLQVRALWRRAQPLDSALGAEIAAGAGLPRKVQVCASDEVDRPSVIGFFAPRILIPAGLVSKLSPADMEHVVLHEAGHLRRADDWLNLLQKLALVVFPLNPALAWVERRLCFERELACDERVLATTRAPKAYASCLASLAEHRMTRRGLGLVMGALGRESELGQRVRRILARGESMKPVRARLATGAAMFALIAGAAGLEQCPQLIGFSRSQPTPPSLASTAAVSPTYQAIAFRPGAVPARQTATGALRAYNLMARESVDPAARVSTVSTHTAVPATLPAAATRVPSGATALRVLSRTAHARPHPSPAVRTAWVVMSSTTTWNGGSRVVMTSFASAAQPDASTAQPGDATPRPLHASARNPITQAPATFVPAQLIFPYAAVPVRGGWLVFQM